MIIKIWKEQDLELVSELPKQVKEVIKEKRCCNKSNISFLIIK